MRFLEYSYLFLLVLVGGLAIIPLPWAMMVGVALAILSYSTPFAITLSLLAVLAVLTLAAWSYRFDGIGTTKAVLAFPVMGIFTLGLIVGDLAHLVITHISPPS